MHNRKNKKQIDDAQYIDVVIPIYNLIEYSDNYPKSSGILWQYSRDAPAVNGDGATTDFTEANVTDLFNHKVKTNRSNRKQW